MKHLRLAWVASILTLSLPLTASADPALRVQMDLRGDFVLFGNTVAQECANGAPAVPDPIVGTIDNCPNDNPNAPDVYWRSDDPAGLMSLLQIADGVAVLIGELRSERPGGGRR